MYVYDNYFRSVTTDATKRPTRLIIAGYYKQTGDESTWVKSYYPVDITFSETDAYRPVIRNWKYEFVVTSVSGPGKSSLGEARDAQNTDMNINVIQWDKSDVEIGVTGKYYVTMDDRAVTLWRDAGASRRLGLDYRFFDDTAPNDFTLDFKMDEDDEAYLFDNGDVIIGTPTTVGNVTTRTISNRRFRVTMTRTAGEAGGDVAFEIEALMDYDRLHCSDIVVVRYRNLEFEISIDQLDLSEDDWKDGGEIPTDI
jgi:hypothetical protein